jgi:hypothetical protein
MRYMKPEEFACNCCGVNGTTQELMNRIDEARGIAGIPFRIHSGWRCDQHNEAIGSTSTVHPDGVAADIHTPDSRSRLKVVDALIQAGFNRIGIGKDFVHGDLSQDKSSFVMWTYY